MAYLEEKLNFLFGHSNFRYPQKEIVQEVLHKKNVLAVLPTGAGKSLCYQLPATLLPGMTVIISPLLSLMQDQVASLTKKGIAAATWNSSTPNEDQVRIALNIQKDQLKLLYLSPEKFSHPRIQKILYSVKISTICIDEAHCIDQWGHDFRPEYLKMASLIHELQSHHQCGLAALTATAPPRTVRLIKEQFFRTNCQVFSLPYWRGNLRYSVSFPRSEQEKRQMLLALIRVWKREKTGSFLIYAATRFETEWYARWLRYEGFEATAFHAGLEKNTKNKLIQKFLQPHSTLYVTTSAFGMGIDKPDVRWVVHLSPPLSLEAYAQESGRAGRDSQTAQCFLLFRQSDMERNFEFATSQLPKEQFARIQKNAYKMYQFANTHGCLSRYLLRYFWLSGMKRPENTDCFCSNCSPFLPWERGNQNLAL